MEEEAVRRRRSDEDAARRAADRANGAFLHAGELARIRHHLDRVQRGVDEDAEMTGIVFRLLDEYGIDRIELRPISSDGQSYPVDRHPAVLCSRCGGQSFDFGNAYHECRSCGCAFFLVAPDS